MRTEDRWAMITGASGGLGAEFASMLAKRGYNLVLTARGVERLRVAAVELRASFGVQVHVERSDLGEQGAAMSVLEAVRARGVSLDVLVNNAGRGMHGDFIDQPALEIDRMLQLNMASLTALTHSLAADMAERGGGYILLVASLTAFMPCPTYATYAASKAYVRSFGEALHEEMKPRGVVVTVLSPGLMNTGFLHAAGQKPGGSMKSSMTSPRMAAEAGLNALFAGRASVVAGSMNKVAAVATRLIPRTLQTRIMANALNG